MQQEGCLLAAENEKQIWWLLFSIWCLYSTTTI